MITFRYVVVLFAAVVSAVAGNGVNGGEQNQEPDEYLDATQRIAERVGPEMEAFVGAVLASPWKEAYGLAGQRELGERPEALEKVKLAERKLRDVLQRLMDEYQSLRFLSAAHGRYALLVERPLEGMRRPPGTQPEGRGDLVSSPRHGLVFGARIDGSRPATSCEGGGEGEALTCRTAVFSGSSYVGDLLLQFGTCDNYRNPHPG